MRSGLYTLKSAPCAASLQHRPPALSMLAEWHVPHLCSTRPFCRQVVPNGVRSLYGSRMRFACSIERTTSLRRRPVHSEGGTEEIAQHLLARQWENSHTCQLGAQAGTASFELRAPLLE